MLRSLLPLALAGLALPAKAQLLDVTVNGSIEFNLVSSGPLSQAPAGGSATVTFQVDATDFLDSPNFPTRGYRIQPGTFALDLGPGSLPLADPFPPGDTPYFVIRNDDPAVDGFFVATSVDFPVGVPLDLAGGFGAFGLNFSVTYTGDTLASLDVEDAAGEYDFGGLTVFGFTITDGPFDAVGLIFESLEIVDPSAPVCGIDAAVAYESALVPPAPLTLTLSGDASPGGSITASLGATPALVGAVAGFSTAPADLPLFGGALLIDPAGQFLSLPLNGALPSGTVPLPAQPQLAGFEMYLQAGGVTPSLAILLSGGVSVELCP